jgi:hypothetical protein
MHFLFLFLDGVGLGSNDPKVNPFALANTPNIEMLLDGHKLVLESLVNGSHPLITDSTTLLGIDAKLGVEGVPQSATGQAAILTGVNIPAAVGRHYGPKPDPAIRRYLQKRTLFHILIERGYRTTLLNAYPDSYFKAITSGRRLPGTVAMAALEAAIPLKNTRDLLAGQAISADFTGLGWRERLHIPGIPVLSLFQAGERLALLSRDYDFSFFEYWITDYTGHKSDMDQSIQMIENFDVVLGGLVSAWNPNHDLLFITSDHGNLEDQQTRKHTLNLVPGLIIGPREIRDSFQKSLTDLADITPAILKIFK